MNEGFGIGQCHALPLLYVDFSEPVIRGMFAFHRHLLNHEDKGMMAKILFE
jgi:suppressor of ftsI